MRTMEINGDAEVKLEGSEVQYMGEEGVKRIVENLKAIEERIEKK